MKMLIVDDMVEFLDLEKTFLRRADCEILTATTGLEAIKVAHQEKPDIVVLDVEMPEMNGIEATRIFCQTPELKDIPIVILSSTERDEEALAAGARAFYRKPIDENTFFKMVRTFVPIKVRQEERKTLGVRCNLKLENGTIETELVDISTTGALVVSDTPLHLGDKLHISFAVPGSEEIEADAHVVRDAQLRGYGLGFSSISERAVKSIKQYVYS